MDRDSLEEVADVARAAARSRLIRRGARWVFGAVFIWAVAFIRGWDESISRVEDVSNLARRVGQLERFAADAGVAIDVLEVQSTAIDAKTALTAKQLAEHIEADNAKEVAHYRAIVLSNVPRNCSACAEAAVKQYERLVRKNVDPYEAMDITLKWSAPPR